MKKQLVSGTPSNVFIKGYLGMAGLFLSYRFCFMSFYIHDISFNEWASIAIRGLIFDHATTCALLLPFGILLTGTFVSQKHCQWWYKIAFSYYLSVFLLALIIVWSNLFYYHYLHTCINHTIWGWLTEWRFVKDIIVEDGLLRWSLIGCLTLTVVGLFFVRALFSRPLANTCARHPFLFVLLMLLCTGGAGGICFFSGGRWLPMQMGDAYFSERSELNEAAHNPLYVLTYTTLSAYCTRQLPELDYEKITEKRRTLPEKSSAAPLPNIVLIIMEGMQDSFTNDSILTPFLHTLKRYSRYYSNAYSSGTHTAHAVFSILTGLPASVSHPFFGKIPHQYASSLPMLLKEKGYATVFMMPHNERFDNMAGFLSLNGFEKILSEKDYPTDKKVNVFGVNDTYLFQRALEEIHEHDYGTPFFYTLLTVSNHIPYIIPDDFPHTGLERKYRIVQYADKALADFFAAAEKEDWFSNTLFILVGDHAREGNGSQFHRIAAHHIALYFYAPSFIPPEHVETLAGQVDLVPTIMGYVNTPHSFKTYGIDLRQEKRNSLFMTSDRGIEYLDSMYYLEYRDPNSVLGRIYKGTVEGIPSAFAVDSLKQRLTYFLK